MRALLFVVSLAACGGSVAPTSTDSRATSSSSPPPASAPTSSPTAPFAPGAAAPAPPVYPVCNQSGPAVAFTSLAEQRAALAGSVWDACGASTLCPDAADPHLYLSPEGDAICAHFCGGDGGLCTSNDPALRHTWAALEVAPGVYDLGFDAERYRILYVGTDPLASMILTPYDGSRLTLQGVGVPVK